MAIPRNFPRGEQPPAGAECAGTSLATTPRSHLSPQPEQAASLTQPFARPAAIERFTNPLFPARRVAVVRRRGGASPVTPCQGLSEGG